MTDTAHIRSVMRVTSVFLTTLGSLIIAVAVLHLHSVMKKERKLDTRVFSLLETTRKLSISGIVLLSIAAILDLSSEILILTYVK